MIFTLLKVWSCGAVVFMGACCKTMPYGMHLLHKLPDQPKEKLKTDAGARFPQSRIQLKMIQSIVWAQFQKVKLHFKTGIEIVRHFGLAFATVNFLLGACSDLKLESCPRLQVNTFSSVFQPTTITSKYACAKGNVKFTTPIYVNCPRSSWETKLRHPESRSILAREFLEWYG